MSKLQTRHALLAAFGVVLLHSATYGNNGVWITDKTGLWSDPANWSGGVPNAIADIATLSRPLPSGYGDITLDTTITVSSLVFDSSIYYRIFPATGGSLVFASSTPLASIVVSQQNKQAPWIAAPILLTANLEVTNNSPKPLVLDGPISGTGSLSFVGGRTSLYGANSYTGITTISGGYVVANSGGLGTSDAGTVITGGGLSLNAPVDEPITVFGGSFTPALGQVNTNAITLAGGILARIPTAPGAANRIASVVVF